MPCLKLIYSGLPWVFLAAHLASTRLAAELTVAPNRVNAPCPYYYGLLENGYRAAQGQSAPTSFEVGRGSRDYVERTGQPFRDAVAALGPNETIVDFGDGKGNFGRELTANQSVAPLTPVHERFRIDPIQKKAEIEQYVEADNLVRAIARGNVAPGLSVVGVSYKPGETETVRSPNGRYRQILGDFDALDPRSLPRNAAVGVDFFGIYSYSRNLSVTLRQMTGTIKKGGKIFIVTDRPKRASQMGTYIYSDGKLQTDVEWMQANTQGLKIRSYDVKSVGYESPEYVIEIEVTGEVRIPDLEDYPEYTNSKPPHRVFKHAPSALK